jgi:hypothetical protein
MKLIAPSKFSLVISSLYMAGLDFWLPFGLCGGVRFSSSKSSLMLPVSDWLDFLCLSKSKRGLHFPGSMLLPDIFNRHPFGCI